MGSVLLKLHRLEALRFPRILEAQFAGGVRIVMGVIFGSVACFLLGSGLIGGRAFETTAGILLAAFAAAWSERLIPEVIDSVAANLQRARKKS